MKKILACFLAIFSCACFSRAQTTLNITEFKNPPNSSKVHAWWHWVGGNITKDGITKDLEAMKEHGIAEATIFNIGEIYSKKVDVPKVKFNSPEWIAMFQWALQEANRLGITLGVQTIDGFATVGGSWITPELSMKQYVWTRTSVEGGKELNVKLAEPLAVKNFYRDEAMVAFPMQENTNSFVEARPEIEVNNVSAGNILFDANPKTEIGFKKNNVVDIRFGNEFTADKMVLYPHLPFSWDLPLVDSGRIKLFFAVSTSNDGKVYTKVADLQFTGVNKAITATFPAITAKYFRLQLVKTSFVYFDMLPIAELELLKANELPLFQPSVTSFLEKTSSVYDLNENALDANGENQCKPISQDSIVEISKYMSSDGTLKWAAPNGRWQIIRFGYTSTGVMVDPASPEGLGLEVDKMDTTALNVHINSYAKKLVEAAGKYKGNTLKFFVMDSWEAQFQTWSKNFAKEFERRRGYSILPWIPVLCGETVASPRLSEAFLFDFRKTIGDLIDQNFYKHFAELCHRNQMEYHGEAIYGGWGAYPPIDALKSNEYIDMPMTEFWAGANADNLLAYQPANRAVTSMPTSSALAFGKQIIGSEAYTGNAHYSETPGDLKPYGDAAFCAGVNQIILHSYVHQPFDLKPGMTLGKFGGHYNRNNPVWEFNQDWLKYQARVQYVLQKGEPVVDVLSYTGDELPLFFSKNFLSDLPFGIRPNACNIGMLKHTVKVIDGKLTLGGKQRFSLLLLDNSTKMELSTLKRIAELVNDGAVVYGPKPLEMLALTDIKNEAAVFNKLANEVWGNTNEHSYGKGKVFTVKPLQDVLDQLHVIPDLTTNTKDPKEIMYIHKTLGDTDIYFVFNQQNSVLNRELLFRVMGKTPEIWNAENGNIIQPAVYAFEENQTRLPVSFKPYESKIFIFKNKFPAHFIHRVSLAGKQVFPYLQTAGPSPAIPQAVLIDGKFAFTSDLSGDYGFETNKKKSIKVQLGHPKMVSLENSKTRIEFFPITNEVIPPIEVTALKSLTDFDDPAIKYFAGKARYTINFSIPGDFPSRSDSIVLDLGNISATAEVTLNGKLLAYPWQSNTRLVVSGLLKAENKLVINVATVCRNRFIGDLIQFGSVKSLWTTSPIETILNKGMPLMPSGLTGPIRLMGFQHTLKE